MSRNIAIVLAFVALLGCNDPERPREEPRITLAQVAATHPPAATPPPNAERLSELRFVRLVPGFRDVTPTGKAGEVLVTESFTHFVPDGAHTSVMELPAKTPAWTTLYRSLSPGAVVRVWQPRQDGSYQVSDIQLLAVGERPSSQREAAPN
jgi:hypothetical protein